MLDDISAFVGGVLNERRAGDIAYEVAAGNVGHKLFVARGDGPGLYDLGRVDDDAGFRTDRAFDLAGRIFHALVARDGDGYVVNDCQHIVRAGFNARLAADT